MPDSELRPTRNRLWGVVPVAMLALGSVAVLWSLHAGDRDPENSLWALLAFDLFVLLMIAAMIWPLYRHFGTRLRADGIAIPRLRGQRLVTWSSIRAMKQGPIIELTTTTEENVQILRFIYNETELNEFLQAHLPETVSRT